MSAKRRSSNDWARAHGFALILALGLLMIVAATVLIAADRDANFLVAGGTVLLVMGALAGRLTRLRLGKEGFEADLTELAVGLRQAEAAVEKADTEDPNAAPDPAEVLQSAAAVVSARSPNEREAKLNELTRSVRSPFETLRRALDWVTSLEKAAGRNPEQLRTLDIGDLSSPPRTIEVKAVRSSMRGYPGLRLTEAEVRAAQENPNFYIYVAEFDDDSHEFTRLRVFSPARLERLITAARRRTWYEIPLRSPEYQEAPGTEALSPNWVETSEPVS